MSKLAEKVWKDAWEAMCKEHEETGTGWDKPVAIIDAALEERYRTGMEALRDILLPFFDLIEKDIIREETARLLEEKS